MTPLVIYRIERMAGIWPQGDPGASAGCYKWVKGSWIPESLRHWLPSQR